MCVQERKLFEMEAVPLVKDLLQNMPKEPWPAINSKPLLRVCHSPSLGQNECVSIFWTLSKKFKISVITNATSTNVSGAEQLIKSASQIKKKYKSLVSLSQVAETRNSKPKCFSGIKQLRSSKTL